MNREVFQGFNQSSFFSMAEQKHFLLDNIDKAIAIAPKQRDVEKEWDYGASDYVRQLSRRSKLGHIEDYSNEIASDAYNKNKKNYGVVEFKIDKTRTIYTIINTKEELKKFKDTIKKKFPSRAYRQRNKLGPRKLPGRTKGRIQSIDGWYYNEFVPRKQEIIENVDQQYLTKDLFTDGYYMVRVDENFKPKFPVNTVKNRKYEDMEIMFEGEFVDAEIMGETLQPTDNYISHFACAHIVGKDYPDQYEDLFQAKYVDVILTLYPNAEVKIKKSDQEADYSFDMALFLDQGKPVGVIMPAKGHLKDRADIYDFAKTNPYKPYKEKVKGFF